MKKMIKNIIIIILILICLYAIVFFFNIDGKVRNYIYGLSHPPIPLHDIYTSTFSSDEQYPYNRITVYYRNKVDNIYYEGTITDKKVIDNLFKLAGNMKGKQMVCQDTYLGDERIGEFRQDNSLVIVLKPENCGEYFFCILNMQYISFGETYNFDRDKREIVEGADELFDYLNTIGDYVEPFKRRQDN